MTAQELAQHVMVERGLNTADKRLKLPGKTVTTILPMTGVREHFNDNLTQSARIIQFPVQNPGALSPNYKVIWAMRVDFINRAHISRNEINSQLNAQ